MKLVSELICFWFVPSTLIFSYEKWVSIPWTNSEFLFYIIVVPAIGTYLVVATGAGWLKLWGFNTKYSYRKVPFQIGFIYSGIINILLLLIVNLFSRPASFKPVFLLCLFMFLLGAFAGCLYDIIGVHFGLMDVQIRRFYRGENTLRIVAVYGPWFFGIMGLLSSLSAKYGRYMLIEKDLFSGHQNISYFPKLLKINKPIPYFYVVYFTILYGLAKINPAILSCSLM